MFIRKVWSAKVTEAVLVFEKEYIISYPPAIRLAERRCQAVSLFYKDNNEFIISFFFKFKKIYIYKKKKKDLSIFLNFFSIYFIFFPFFFIKIFFFNFLFFSFIFIFIIIFLI